jgi:SNF2 family DNA or RNA helicase
MEHQHAVKEYVQSLILKARAHQPLKEGQSSTAPVEQLERAKVGAPYILFSRLTSPQKVAESLVHKLLPNFFLRRTKELLRGKMPNKNDQIVFCPLTEKQQKVYRNFLATEEVQRLLMKDEVCDCGSREK